MTDTYRIQTLQVLLNQANDACKIERDLRAKAEQRTAQSRVLWFEMAQRLVPIDLDDLWKTTDVNCLPDDQFARGLGQKLDRYLFEYRAMRRGRDTEQLAR